MVNVKKMSQFDRLIKLLLIGDSMTGKSCLSLRYSDDCFTSSFTPTIGIDFKVKSFFVGESKVKLQIWDTAGQERFRPRTKAHYRGTVGFLLVYDVTNEESFINIRNIWMSEIDQFAAKDVHLVLVGNKADCDASDRKVSTEEGRALAAEFKMKFFETSAKLNTNVEECFVTMAKDLVDSLNDENKRAEAEAEAVKARLIVEHATHVLISGATGDAASAVNSAYTLNQPCPTIAKTHTQLSAETVGKLRERHNTFFLNYFCVTFIKYIKSFSIN